MDTAFGRRRHKRRPVINITSLIDVMFILLIFLMVTTTFREHVGIDITLPHADTATEQELTPHEITVDASGEVYLGGKRVDADGLRAALVELIAADPEATLVLRADERADWGRVLLALDITRDVGGNRLVIPTQLPQPGQD